MIGCPPLIAIIQLFYLACAGSWWPDDEFGIVSVIYMTVKYLSYIKLKPTFFPEGGNSISYVRNVVS